MKEFLSKHRKLFIMLPVFLFISGGIFLMVKNQFTTSKQDVSLTDSSQVSKFNDKLPAPNVREKEKNKFELYMQAQQDSAEKSRYGDSYGKRFFDPGPPEDSSGQSRKGDKPNLYENLNQQEEKVKQQLAKIEAELGKQPTVPQVTTQNDLDFENAARQAEINRLEQMITGLQQTGSTGDSELLQSISKLEKLVQSENPISDKKEVIKDSADQLPVTLFKGRDKPTVGFHNLSPHPMEFYKYKKAIRAVVLAGQTLVNGSTIKLRLTDKIYLDQVEIPAQTSLDGLCTINDERLLIQIDRITYEGTIYPVRLAVYDNRGMPGLHVPGAITRDAAKESLAQTMQSMNSYGVSSGVASEITASAVQGVGNLISKKARLIKVQISTDFNVLLQ